MEEARYIHKLLLKFGGSPWRFNIAMLTNFHKWNNISISDLFALLVELRNDLMCNYSLIPFFVRYTKVDIRFLYEYIQRETDWSNENFQKLSSIFPNEFSFSEESSLKNLGFINLKDSLKLLSDRLLCEVENFKNERL